MIGCWCSLLFSSTSFMILSVKKSSGRYSIDESSVLLSVRWQCVIVSEDGEGRPSMLYSNESVKRDSCVWDVQTECSLSCTVEMQFLLAAMFSIVFLTDHPVSSETLSDITETKAPVTEHTLSWEMTPEELASKSEDSVWNENPWAVDKLGSVGSSLKPRHAVSLNESTKKLYWKYPLGRLVDRTAMDKCGFQPFFRPFK